MVRLFSKSRKSCNPCKSEIIQATQTAVDVSAQAENKVSNLQEDVIINTGAIAGNKVTAETALTQAGDALVTAQQAKQTAESISAVADNAITLATDAQSAVETVEDELTAIQAKNAQQDTDIRDLQQDYIDTDAHLTAVETDLEGHETNYNNPHRVTAAQLGLGSAVNYKGQVTNYADLPTSGNTKGDMYNVVNAYLDYPAHSNVIWDGAQWDNTGGTIDFSGIQNQIDTLSGTVTANKTAVDTEITGIKTLNTTQTQQITALQTGKQDKLTAGSGIAISNGVITATGYSGEVDTALSTTSTNPVTNKAITEAINGKQAAGNYALKSEVTAVASDLADAEATINGHITAADARLTNLEQSLSAVDQRVTANATKNTEQDSTLRSLQVELDGKQNILSFDTTPTAGSSKPVTSNGVYEALQGAGKDWVQIVGKPNVIVSHDTYYEVVEDIKIGLCTFGEISGVGYMPITYGEIVIPKGFYKNDAQTVNGSNFSINTAGSYRTYFNIGTLYVIIESDIATSIPYYFYGGTNPTFSSATGSRLDALLSNTPHTTQQNRSFFNFSVWVKR